MQSLDGTINLKWFKEFLEEHRDSYDKAVVEKVHAIFGSAAGATFNFGRTCGHIEATLSALSIPFEFVRPVDWQKEFFSVGGKLSSKDRKERCVLAAQRNFPKLDLRASERSRTPHLGMVDALLIAEFGWRNRK